MGMAASQARMLSLTSRLSDLEYSAQSISNSKMALSRKSQDASDKYLLALDKEKLTVLNPDKSTYVDATAKNLTTYNAISSLDKQRFLKTASGQVIVSQEIATAYEKAKANTNSLGLSKNWLSSNATNDSKIDLTVIENKGTSDQNYQGQTTNFINNNYMTMDEVVAYDEGLKSGEEIFLNAFKDESTGLKYSNCVCISQGQQGGTISEDKSGLAYYKAIFAEIEDNGYMVIDESKLNDSDWLYEQLNNGTLYLSEWDDDGGKDGEGDFVNISWTSGDSTLVTKNDEVDLAKAEAEYESTTAEISAKDKRFDMQLKTVDTEHSAIQTEIDSVKKVIDKNIERSFKIFDA